MYAHSQKFTTLPRNFARYGYVNFQKLSKKFKILSFFQILDGYFDFLVGFNITNCL